VAGLRERDPRNGMKELLDGSFIQQIPFCQTSSLIPAGSCPSFGMAGCLSWKTLSFLAKARWNSWMWVRHYRKRRSRGKTCDGFVSLWPGPIIVKGLLTGDDGRRAVDEGAAAVVVSNHGGRQLDSVFSDAPRAS